MESLRKVLEWILKVLAGVVPDPTPDDRQVRSIYAVAMDVIATFEGGSWGVHGIRDAGVITYGMLGFTLASGNLLKVLERYAISSGKGVPNDWLARVQSGDTTLAGERAFIDWLNGVAETKVMRDAQRQVARELLEGIATLSIYPRGIQTPLGWLLILDMGVNHGARHGYIYEVEKALGIPHKTRIADEKAFIKALARARLNLTRDDLKVQYPGLVKRFEWFIEQTEAGNWNVVNISVKGNRIQTGRVRFPKSDIVPIEPPEMPPHSEVMLGVNLNLDHRFNPEAEVLVI